MVMVSYFDASIGAPLVCDRACLVSLWKNTHFCFNFCTCLAHLFVSLFVCFVLVFFLFFLVFFFVSFQFSDQTYMKMGHVFEPS